MVLAALAEAAIRNRDRRAAKALKRRPKLLDTGAVARRISRRLGRKGVGFPLVTADQRLYRALRPTAWRGLLTWVDDL